MRIPAFRVARSFRNVAAPGSTYVQGGAGGIVVIHYVFCSKAWLTFALFLVSIYWNLSCGERNCLRM